MLRLSWFSYQLCICQKHMGAAVHIVLHMKTTTDESYLSQLLYKQHEKLGAYDL